MGAESGMTLGLSLMLKQAAAPLFTISSVSSSVRTRLLAMHSRPDPGTR